MLRVCLLLGAIVFALPNTSAGGCSGWISRSPTFREEATLPYARFIVYGKFASSQLSENGLEGRTDIVIETTLRGHPAMKEKTWFIVPRDRRVEKNDTRRYVIFCDVEKGKVDPYRGVVLQNAASVEYVKKAIALDAKDTVKNLIFYFGHLDDPDPEVARDASYECSLANDKDIRAARRELNVEVIRKRLRDSKTFAYRVRLYARLLGECGSKEDVVLLESLLAPVSSEDSTFPSFLTALAKLDPKKGWAFALHVAKNLKTKYPDNSLVLSAVRSLSETKPSVWTKTQFDEIYRLFLRHDEIVDEVIDDLRLAKRWDLSKAVLEVAKSKEHDSPIVKRTLLRYALQCKGDAEAEAYVAMRRKADPKEVADVQEGIDLETQNK